MAVTLAKDSAITTTSVFSFTGRASRSSFWTYFAAAWALGFVTLIPLMIGLSMEPEWPFEKVAFAILVIYVPAAVAVLSVMARRLHDLGLSAHWLWLLPVAKLMPIVLHFADSDAIPMLGPLGSIAGSVFIVAAFLYLGFAKGTGGSNVYGPDPLQTVGAQDATLRPDDIGVKPYARKVSVEEGFPMRILILVVIALGVAAVAFAMTEWNAAPTTLARAKTPEACQQICGPHCVRRWGPHPFSVIPRHGCFITCIQFACRPA